MPHLVADAVARAVSVKVEKGWVCVLLDDDREIRFPATKSRRLQRGTPEQVANVEIICRGTGLHWPDMDEDLSVQGIVEGRFGQ